MPTTKKTTTKNTVTKKPEVKKVVTRKKIESKAATSNKVEPKATTPNPTPIDSQKSPNVPVSIIVVILLAIGAIYYSYSKDKAPETEIKGTGLDQNQEVKTIADVEEVIAKWVETNPEAIIGSVVKMQQKAVQDQQQAAQKNISSKNSEIFNLKSDPAITPKGYNITIVEFFDYNCGYCKKAEKTVSELLATDKKVKFVFKEYPILGPSSVELSKVAIAVNMVSPNNYLAFHNALMSGSARDLDGALRIAQTIPGLDVEAVRNTLSNKAKVIQAKIDSTKELAISLGINGTPAFIVGEELIPGAVGIDSLRESIKKNRK